MGEDRGKERRGMGRRRGLGRRRGGGEPVNSSENPVPPTSLMNIRHASITPKINNHRAMFHVSLTHRTSLEVTCKAWTNEISVVSAEKIF